MGLAGQREKQRISDDPNNLFWSKDESKFGFRMLQKMGWSPGKGLGANEDGHKDHIKIRLKDNTLGVGATKKNIDNWLGNTDAYSRLLADLNSQTNSEASSVNGDDNLKETDEIINKAAVDSSASSDDDDKKEKKKKKSKKDKKEKKKKSSGSSSKKSKDEKKKEKSSKKRSRDESDDEGEKRKSKKSKKDKKKSDKKDKKDKKESASSTAAAAAPAAPAVLRNAARAKFLRAKKMASASGDKSMNEILGIKTSTTTKSTSGYQTIETSEATFMASFSV